MSLTALIYAYDNMLKFNKKKYQSSSKTNEYNNRCVHGDTKVLTYQGYKNIKDLNGKRVSIWNGTQWSVSTILKSGETQGLLLISTSDGIQLKCTPYHKFLLNSGKIVEAHRLVIGETLMQCNNWPMIDGVEEITGDTIPINASIHNKRRWLANFINTHKSTDKALTELVLECTTNDMAMDVKYLCNTIGCSPTVYFDEWTSQVIFSPKDTYYLFQIMRLPSKYRNIETGINQHMSNYITIKSIEVIDGLHDTYYIDEPFKHTAIFNGLLTKN